jgi:hypothetical protein
LGLCSNYQNVPNGGGQSEVAGHRASWQISYEQFCCRSASSDRSVSIAGSCWSRYQTGGE